MFSQKMLVASVLGSLLLAGCGSSGSKNASSSNNKPTDYLVGQFWSVANINYKTQTQQGVTNSQGHFHYKAGETVVFSFGDIILPTINAAPIVSPRDFGYHVGRTATVNDEKIDVRDITDTTATNITRWLVTLDSDGMPDNGIQLDKAAALIFTHDVQWDTPPEEFDTEISADFTKLYTQTPKLAVAPQLLSPYVGYFYLAKFLNEHQPGSYTSGYRLSEIEVTDNKNKRLETHTYLYGQAERLVQLNVLTYYSADGSPKPAQTNSYSYNNDGSLQSHERSNFNYWVSNGDGSLLKKTRDDYVWTKNTLTSLTTFNLTAGSAIKEQSVEYVYSPFLVASQTKTTDFLTTGTDVAVWSVKNNSRWLYREIKQPDGSYREFSYDDGGLITVQSVKDAADIEELKQKATYNHPSPGKRVKLMNNQYYTETYSAAQCTYEQLQKGLRAPQSELECLPSYFFDQLNVE